MKSLTYRQLVRILKRNGFVLHHRHLPAHPRQKNRIRTSPSWQPAAKNRYVLSYYQTVWPGQVRVSEKVVAHSADG